MVTGSKACTHCHLCQEQCDFLKKYQIDIGDTEKLEGLSYHCFLCGRCSRACPRGIDGREIILNMRIRAVSRQGKASLEKVYGRLLREKADYKYKNYRHLDGKSVLFPGCNFPSFYPKTTKKLVDLMKTTGNTSVVYDCCGKPVAELGMQEQEERIIGRIREKLQAQGIQEVVMVCPNCYYFLKDRLGIRVVSIYEKLNCLRAAREGLLCELEEQIKTEKEPANAKVFIPCPDQDGRELYEAVRPYLPDGHTVVEDVQCCGLGGCALVHEKDLAKSMASRLKDYDGTVYTYCASCAGNLARGGVRHVRHILVELLQTGERPDTVKSMLNRHMTKYW